MTGSTEELDRLESWKQIAAHLNKSERTVRRWHELEGLPVHKHQHRQRGSVWAYRSELDQWLADRTIRPEEPSLLPRRKWPIGIGVLAALAAIGGILVTRPQSGIRSAERALPLTALPGAEYGASFSPDGNRVVFYWGKVDQVQSGLYVKEVDKEVPTPLVLSPVKPKVFFYSPAWSPDGATIAFLERTATDGTWLCAIAANGGVHHRLRQIAQPPDLFIANNQHVSWSRDSQSVIVPIARGNERGIYRISLATGEAVVIAKAESAYAPALSPDGRSLVWLRRKGLPIAYEEVVLTRLQDDGAAHGDPILLYKGDFLFSGIAWAASNKSLVVCSSETMLWGPFFPRLYQLPAVAGAGMTELGGNACNTVTVSAKGMMAYGSTMNSRSNLMRTSLQAPATPGDLVPSSRYDSYPGFSPDGGRIAFYSNRSGMPEIWVVNSDGSGLRRVTENSKVHSGPSWSPGGNEIVYASGRSLLISTLSGEKVTRIDVDGPPVQHPVWSADGNTVYFTAGNYLYQTARDGRGPRVIREFADVLMLAEGPDGKHLYYSRPGQPFALLRMHTSGGQEEVVEEGMGFPCFAITAQALYLVRRDMALYALPHSGGQARKITSVPPFDSGGHSTWETRFTVSPDDSTLVWVRVAPQEIDLEMRKLP
jgi:Tol biopolymer transport system component